MQKKRMMAVVIAAIMMLSTLSVSAEWVFAGYDTTNLNAIGKIYNEVINGEYTGNVKIDPVAEEDIEWKEEGFEYAYPHAGYSRLYLEGNAQYVTKYNNKFPQWETRFVDYFWEMTGKACTDRYCEKHDDCEPNCEHAEPHKHMIYQRQQSNIPGYGWRWDYSADPIEEAKLCVRTNRAAEVAHTYEYYGVGPFDMNGKYVTDPDVLAMYDRFGVNNKMFDLVPGTDKDILDGTFFSEENLSVKDFNGQFVVSDEEIASYACSIQSKFVTGPSFRGEDPTKDLAAAYLAVESPETKDANVWDWEDHVLRYGGAQVSWTPVMFELQEPYRMYQYLIINGLVFDGRDDLPRIFRYTGGVATPTVEWKYAYAEFNHPHPVIQFKYVDGKLALDSEGNPIYRVPTGEYAKAYARVSDTHVAVYLKDAYGDVELYTVPRTATIGFYDGYYAAGNNVIR